MHVSYGPLHRASHATQFLPFGREPAVPVHDGAPFVWVGHGALFHRTPGFAAEDRIQLEVAVWASSVARGRALGGEGGERQVAVPRTDVVVPGGHGGGSPRNRSVHR